MALRVETVMMGPQTSQYAGQGQAATGVAGVEASTSKPAGSGSSTIM